MLERQSRGRNNQRGSQRGDYLTVGGERKEYKTETLRDKLERLTRESRR